MAEKKQYTEEEKQALRAAKYVELQQYIREEVMEGKIRMGVLFKIKELIIADQEAS